MARLFTFDCKCGYQTAKRVEFTPSEHVEQIGEARFRVDLTQTDIYNGYPDQVIECPSCGKPITSVKMELWAAPPLYFNYMSDED